MLNTPVLFLIFNRPDTTQQVFNAIREAQPRQLFIAADGPRPQKGEEELCKQARQVVQQVDWYCEVKTLYRENNLGCKIAVSQAIDWFFQQVEEGIILEDDTLPVPYFFEFCSALLDQFRGDNNVMHISGANFQFGLKRNNGRYYLSRYPLIWGWASWRRAWQHYDNRILDDEKQIEQTLTGSMKRKADIAFYKDIMLKVKANQIDTWDYQWLYAVLKNKGVCLTPKDNLVKNIGFDDRATHTSSVPYWWKYMHYASARELPPPNTSEVDEAADLFYVSLCRNHSTFEMKQVQLRYWINKLFNNSNSN